MPTPREQLSEAMRNARLEAGFRTHRELAKRMNTSRPAISRAESPNQAVPSEPLLAAWARACRVPVEEFLEIVARAKSGTPEWFGPYLGAEQAATRLRFWESTVVPGVLQTPEYAYALERSETVVSQRLERQEQVLGRVAVTAVIDAMVLQRCIGSRAVMAGQCSHIAQLVESERIRLHVVPDGQNVYLGGAVAMASKHGHVTVSMSVMTRDITSTEANLVEEIQTAFDALLGIALHPVPSLEYVRQQEERWKSQV